MDFEGKYNGKQHYSFEDEHFHLNVKNTRDSILGVVLNMFGAYGETASEQILIPKIRMICTEALSNIAIHEKCGKFEVITEIKDDMMFLTFVIEGNDISKELVEKNLAIIESTQKHLRPLLDTGMGIYCYKKNSDYFEIVDMCSIRFKELRKGIIFGFSLVR